MLGSAIRLVYLESKLHQLRTVIINSLKDITRHTINSLTVHKALLAFVMSFIMMFVMSLSVIAQDKKSETETDKNKPEYYKLFFSETSGKGEAKYNVMYFQSHISSERFIKNISIEFGKYKNKTEYKWPKIKYLKWSEKPMILEINDVLCNGEDHCISFTLHEQNGNDVFDPDRKDFDEIMNHFQKKVAKSYFRSLVFF